MKKILHTCLVLLLLSSLYAAAEDKEQKPAEEEKPNTEKSTQDKMLEAHENGKYQFELTYTSNHFQNYNYNNPWSPGILPKWSTQGIGLLWQYFPVRKPYGRIGIGPRIGFYGKIIKNGYREENQGYQPDLFPAIKTIGAEATYEAQYWPGQWFVPFIFLGYDKGFISYTAPTIVNNSNGTTTTNPYHVSQSFDSIPIGAGLKLNLNRLEPSAASAATTSVGIKKFYFSVYVLSRQAANSQWKSTSTFFGLHFEY